MDPTSPRLLVAGLLLLTATALFAAEGKRKKETLSGRVVEVIDGDTFTLLVVRTRHKVRLAAIDAPELKQPFGEEARKQLSKRLLRKTIRLEVLKRDRDGTIYGIVRLEKACVNVELVREGYAWHDNGVHDSPTLAKAEKQARAGKRGLWAAEDPVPPWDWRVREKSARAKQTHWLNVRSNVRHNRNCKYFAKTKQGRFCGPNEGTACRICGG